MAYFKAKQFKQDIIMVAVGYYLGDNLSCHDISEILRERGIEVGHTMSTNGFNLITANKAPSYSCTFK